MKLAKTFARAASFAHLLGLAAKAEDDDTAANAEDQTDDDERKQRDGESDAYISAFILTTRKMLTMAIRTITPTPITATSRKTTRPKVRVLKSVRVVPPSSRMASKPVA